MNTYISTPCNTAKLGTAAHSNNQTAESSPTLIGSESTILVSTPLSQRISTLFQCAILYNSNGYRCLVEQNYC